MFKTCKSLPDNYTLHASIDLVKNKKTAIIFNLFSVILFVIPFILLALIQDFVYIRFSQFFIGTGLSIIYIFIHEWIHAFFFKIKNWNTVKVKYGFHGFAASAGVPGVYFQRLHFMMISLAPFVVTTLALIPLMVVVNSYWFLILFFLFSINLSGSSGDFYLFIKLLFMSKNVLIEDYGPGMRFFIPNDSFKKSKGT